MHLQSKGCISWSVEPSLDGMKMRLNWCPTPPNIEPNYLPEELRNILVRRYWNHKELTKTMTFTFTDVPYLQGLMDGKVDGADELIDAINRYKSVDVRLG